MVKLKYLVGHGSYEAVNDILVGEEIRALHRVPGVKVEAVPLLGPQHTGRSALGGDRMGSHELDLGDYADADAAAAGALSFYGGPEAGEPRAQD